MTKRDYMLEVLRLLRLSISLCFAAAIGYLLLLLFEYNSLSEARIAILLGLATIALIGSAALTLKYRNLSKRFFKQNPGRGVKG